MNKDHALAGVGGVSTTAMLAGVIAHFQGVDPATASAEAGLLIIALGALGGLAQNWLAVRKPPAPPTVDHPPPGSPAANP